MSQEVIVTHSSSTEKKNHDFLIPYLTDVSPHFVVFEAP